jgi:hypothetical protein
MNAEAIWIATGKQAATRGGADRLGDMKVAEYAALRCETIEVGSDETFCAEHADVRVALIVGEDDDDIGELRARYGRGLGVSAEEQECEEHRAQ